MLPEAERRFHLCREGKSEGCREGSSEGFREVRSDGCREGNSREAALHDVLVLAHAPPGQWPSSRCPECPTRTGSGPPARCLRRRSQAREHRLPDSPSLAVIIPVFAPRHNRALRTFGLTDAKLYTSELAHHGESELFRAWTCLQKAQLLDAHNRGVASLQSCWCLDFWCGDTSPYK